MTSLSLGGGAIGSFQQRVRLSGLIFVFLAPMVLLVAIFVDLYMAIIGMLSSTWIPDLATSRWETLLFFFSEVQETSISWRTLDWYEITLAC